MRAKRHEAYNPFSPNKEMNNFKYRNPSIKRNLIFLRYPPLFLFYVLTVHRKCEDVPSQVIFAY
jgi:hypothetical protein